MNTITLKKILLQENIVQSINNNLNELLLIIPEIKDMINFEHNHPHHHLDVWNHTLLALSLSPTNFEIRLVLLLHDIGKPHSYQDEEIRHFKNHAEVSSNISNIILKRLNFRNDEIEELCSLIREHDTIITENELKNNKNKAYKKFQIQFCDALAHNPNKLEKRINYLLEIINKLNIKNNNYELILKNKLKK